MIWDFIKRKVLRLSRDRWNYQYRRGQWTGLHAEHGRFTAVKELMKAIHPKPAILEIGCGDAILFQQLPDDHYSSFDGVDISDVAITSARRFERPGIAFSTGDMQSFIPAQQYDIIIFNESLYYSRTPAETLKRYIPFLTTNGSFIVTAVENKYTAHLWPALSADFQFTHQTATSSEEHTWHIRQLKPAR